MYRIPIAKTALMAAVASMTLIGSLAAPQFAAAQQSQYDDGPPPPPPSGDQGYYDPCRRDQANRAVVGGVLGAVAGAVIGNSVTHGGGKVGGALIGGAGGAALGASIGHSTAACDPAEGGPPPPPPGYAENDGPPPPPPPPPPGYYDRAPAYRQPVQDNCGPADERVRYPDGSVEHLTVQACIGRDGRWHVDD